MRQIRNNLVRSFVIFAALALAAPAAFGQCGGGPCNVTQNPYWPAQPGNKWTFRNTATLSPAVMTIQASPPQFGCAPSPIPVYLFKIDPTNYWAPNNPANLRWFMGVKPNQDVIFFAHYWQDFDGVPVYGTNFYRTDPRYDPDQYPPYVLLRGNGPAAAAVDIPMVYFGSDTNGDSACYPVPSSPGSADWQVSWSNQFISTPAFTGTALLADINEVFSGLHEQWSFASGIGPVRIYQANSNITLDLVDYQVGQASSVVPQITFRDLLLGQAGQTSGLNFDQWNYYYARATHQAGPVPEEVCLDPANRGNLLTIDQYLALMENRGTWCSTVQWPDADTVGNYASGFTDTSHGLDWDQWNYYYVRAVPGAVASDTSDVCMAVVSYQDDRLGANSVVPSRWVLYSVRQWYGLVRYHQDGQTCSP